MNGVVKIVITIFVLFFATGSEARMHTFSGRLIDTAGNPVSGAFVYVEVYHNGVYDFGWTLSGRNGEVPAAGYKPIRLWIRPGAQYSFCILTEKMLPFVLNNHQPIDKKSGVGFVINDSHLRKLHLTTNPDLFHLDFPFENNSALRKKLLRKENLPLLEAFDNAYKEAEKDTSGISPVVVKKISILRDLMR